MVKHEKRSKELFVHLNINNPKKKHSKKTPRKKKRVKGLSSLWGLRGAQPIMGFGAKPHLPNQTNTKTHYHEMVKNEKRSKELFVHLIINNPKKKHSKKTPRKKTGQGMKSLVGVKGRTAHYGVWGKAPSP